MQRGFVRKRGAKTNWTAYYYVVENGQRRQRVKGGFATKREATAFLTETLAALQRHDLVTPSKLTLGDYITNHWLPAQRHAIRPSTWDSYRRMLSIHLLPKLGNVPLQELTAQQLDGLYAQLLRTGNLRREGGLAPKTVRYLHNTLQKALKDAERKGLVQRNVALAADPPKQRAAGSAELQTWTAQEVQHFLTAMTDHRLHAAYVLAATTGMRRGEVLGLRWRDVDFAASRLAVRQTVVLVGYELTFGTPKTARGRRSVALDPTTLAALAEHRRLQREERELFGPGYQDLDLVFAKPDGSAIHPDFFSQTFDRSVARLGMRRIRLHDLRHTHATLGLAAGVPPKVMSDRLGHATVAFTQDVYMHAIPALEESAANQVADLIFGGHLGRTLEADVGERDALA
jgi:integrase